MKIVSSGRRQIVMAILLGFAVLGGVIRHYAANPSTLRDIGTLLLVLWLPAVGNLVAFVIRKLPRRQRPVTQFAAGAPFVPHLRGELTPARTVSQRSDFVLVLGSEGFRARTAEPLSLVAGQPVEADFEFLHPQLALARLAAGTEFELMAGPEVVANGRVRV